VRSGKPDCLACAFRRPLPARVKSLAERFFLGAPLTARPDPGRLERQQTLPRGLELSTGCTGPPHMDGRTTVRDAL